jgi:hypothetical protein
MVLTNTITKLPVRNARTRQTPLRTMLEQRHRDASGALGQLAQKAGNALQIVKVLNSKPLLEVREDEANALREELERWHRDASGAVLHDALGELTKIATVLKAARKNEF